MGYLIWWFVSLGLAGLCVALFFALARAKSEVAGLRSVLKEVRADVQEAIDDLDQSVVLQQLSAAEEHRLRELTDHLSEAIGIMQTSRDRWKDMFFVQAHEHGNGQALLERALTRNREIVMKLVASINAVRKERELKPITNVEQLDEPPIGTAEGYREAMKELADKMPTDPDMVVRRDRLLAEAKGADGAAEPNQPPSD